MLDISTILNVISTSVGSISLVIGMFLHAITKNLIY